MANNWTAFRDSGLLWWINMILHTFGWAIVVELNDKSEVVAAYPERVSYRGFSEATNEQGYSRVSNYIKRNLHCL